MHSSALRPPIIAPATASGRGAVGIVRLSGSGLLPLAARLCGRVPEPRCALFTAFRSPEGEVLDRGLALFFPAPHSFTGEDVLELQGHGGPLLLERLQQACLRWAEVPGEGGTALLPGLRRALPGEFSRRAVANGKLDLSQAQSIAALVEARSERAARCALKGLEGEFGRAVEALRAEMMDLRALIEADLDFSDEEVQGLSAPQTQERLQQLCARVESALHAARQGALLTEGLHVAMAGAPNSGKSSLLNVLSGRDLAIVTPIAGTTRDRIETEIAIEGVPMRLSDLAGLRESADPIERIGIERSWQAIASADFLLVLRDPTRAPGDPEESALLARLPTDKPRLIVWNKSDIAAPPQMGAEELPISAKTGVGLETLRQRLLRLAGGAGEAESQSAFCARGWQIESLQRAASHAHSALGLLGDAGIGALEIIAEELRCGHDALGEITGATTPDELLGVIFSRFCIGK